jgi:2-polyprenyl-3-methyl-5-hydroxy-6-metoxy-1,4-benzoquinol methylase
VATVNILAQNKAAWDSIGCDAASPYMEEEMYADSFKQFCQSLPTKARVLDVGCGPGIPVTKALVKAGFNVIGLDLSPKMIALAEHNVPDAQYTCKSITDIDYVEEFHGVMASYSLLCLDHDMFVLASGKIFLALKPRGYCFIALNEGVCGHSDALTRISGQLVYSRVYSEAEIKGAFSQMRIIRLGRAIVESSMYGREQSIVLLLQKPA